MHRPRPGPETVGALVFLERSPPMTILVFFAALALAVALAVALLRRWGYVELFREVRREVQEIMDRPRWLP